MASGDKALDFSAPATVEWWEDAQVNAGRLVSAEETSGRSFPTLEAAIQFAVEDLSGFPRRAARIKQGRTELAGAAIPAAYAALKRERSRKRPRDPNQLAKLIVDIASGAVEDRDPTPEEQGKDPAAVALGRKGGAARRDALSPAQRSDIARQGAARRWAKD
jgi:hypothetical protein